MKIYRGAKRSFIFLGGVKLSRAAHSGRTRLDSAWRSTSRQFQRCKCVSPVAKRNKERQARCFSWRHGLGIADCPPRMLWFCASSCEGCRASRLSPRILSICFDQNTAMDPNILNKLQHPPTTKALRSTELRVMRTVLIGARLLWCSKCEFHFLHVKHFSSLINENTCTLGVKKGKADLE